MNRREINQLLFSGLGVVGQNTVLPDSPFAGNFRMVDAEYNPGEANRLLDQMGLTDRDTEGFRLRPDGVRLELLVETPGEATEEVDTLELVKTTWARLGISLLIRSSQRELFRKRVDSGLAVMSLCGAPACGEFGRPTPDMSPAWLAPVRSSDLLWARWGLFYESTGQRGQPPTLPAAQQLVDLYREWLVSTNSAARARIWKEMLAINAREVFTIGILGATPQSVIIKDGLQGVPEAGVYAWDPGAYFGLYSPDTFYWLGRSPVVAVR